MKESRETGNGNPRLVFEIARSTEQPSNILSGKRDPKRGPPGISPWVNSICWYLDHVADVINWSHMDLALPEKKVKVVDRYASSVQIAPPTPSHQASPSRDESISLLKAQHAAGTGSHVFGADSGLTFKQSGELPAPTEPMKRVIMQQQIPSLSTPSPPVPQPCSPQGEGLRDNNAGTWMLCLCGLLCSSSPQP